MSLDGYIARKNGDIDWLTCIPNPESDDYGYSTLLSSIETIVMGRSTYDSILSFGMPWPYESFSTYVVTSNPIYKISTPNTFLLTQDVNQQIIELNNNTKKDIWIMGGAQLIKTLLIDELIDRMIISIIPKMIGNGIPLFLPSDIQMTWQLIDTVRYNTGIVNLIYQRETDFSK
jgi:dihydrofolate reductase